MIAGQAGQTQWARDPSSGSVVVEGKPGVPVMNDLEPGSPPNDGPPTKRHSFRNSMQR